MRSRFLVTDTFNLGIGSYFVIVGEVLEGTVRPGQMVRTPAGLDAPVHGVEIISGQGRAKPALTFRYRDVAELAAWEALKLPGHTIELDDPDNASDDRT
jgi:hypothetical protein